MRLNWVRLAGALAVLGGLLWLAHVAIFIAHGARTGGRSVMQDVGSVTYWADGFVFASIYLTLGACLLELGLTGGLEGWRRLTAMAGAVVALCPAGAAAVGIVASLTLDPASSAELAKSLGPAAIFTLFAASILVGIAHAGGDVIPRWAGVLLVLFGLLTMPLGLAMPLFKAHAPTYVLDELHFIFAGVLWIAIGLGAIRARPPQGRGFAVDG